MSEEPKPKPTRSPGDRGLFERPKGSGTWWIRYHDENGREHREKIGPKGLAKRVYAKRKTEIAERRFFPAQIRRRETLLGDYLEQYLKDHVEGRLRQPSHYKRYSELLTTALGKKTLREITPTDITRYATRRREKDNMSPATVNRELAFLRRAYNVAIADGLVEKNPVKGVKFAKEDNQRLRYLLPEEEAELRKAIGEEHWPKVAVALHTGMRRGNQFKLQWTDVDFDNGVITLRHSKSGSTYYVPMNDELRAALRALPSRLRSRWVFPSDTGDTPLDAQNFVNRVFTVALKTAGIVGFRWHDLRHTFASRLAMAGVDLRTVQDLMGHKTIAMTLRYAHLSPGHKLAAVQRLTGTGTGTNEDDSTTPKERAPEATEIAGKIGGDGVTRTHDLGIMRPSL